MMNQILPLTAALLPIAAVSAQTTYVVPGTHPTIQAAIAAATNGDTVQVMPGIYAESLDVQGKDIAIRGLGGAANTVIDGAQALGPTVLFSAGSTRAAIFEGFTVTGGNNTSGTGRNTVGGGIRVENASPTIRACFVRANVSSTYGGGIGVTGSPAGPLIESCTIEANQVSGASYASGAGIAISSATPGQTGTEIRRCIISDNDAASRGGGIYLAYSPGCVIDGCRIARNATLTASGSLSGGAGIFLALNSTAVVSNCRVWNNVSGTNGGGVKWFNVSGGAFVNNTIVNNTGGGAAGFANSGGFGLNVYCDFINCILWQNGGAGEFTFAGTDQSGASPYTNVNHSVVTGGYTGTANINLAPQLLNADTGNHHLAATSPCVDAGSVAFLTLPPTDMDGGARTLGNAPDIGADEFDASAPLLTASVATLSAANPGPISYALSNGTPGDFFAVLFGISGVEPGTPIFGQVAPLNADSFTSTITLIGGIDPAGSGNVLFPNPGVVPASVIGITLSAAGITFGSAFDLTNDENVLIVP